MRSKRIARWVADEGTGLTKVLGLPRASAFITVLKLATGQTALIVPILQISNPRLMS